MNENGEDLKSKGVNIKWEKMEQNECQEKCMTEPLATACEYDRTSKKCFAHAFSVGKITGKTTVLCSYILPKGLLIVI